MSCSCRARVAAAAAALAASLAFTASALADATNRNSCQYTYDDYWRDMDITLGGSPSVAAAAAGETVSLNGLTARAALPDWLARYGYNFGLLEAGHNEIPVTVWIAVRASNTTQGVQVHEVETTAETTITVSGGEFASATPFAYDIPPLGATEWTARGGPIVFSQAGSGALPQLPIGPGGRLQKPRGSLYIKATLGVATLGLDCVPGTYFAEGSERQEESPEPFAEVAVPAFACIGAVPAATSVAPVSVELVRRRGLAPAIEGAAYGFTPSVAYRLPNGYLRALYDAGLLADGDNTVAGTVVAAIDAANAIALVSGPAKAATVRVSDGGATIRVIGESGVAEDLAGVAQLGPGSWTPSGGPLGFAAAAPGTLGSLTVDGVAAPLRPYGSVYVRLSLGSGRLSLDCVSGRVTVVPGSAAYSELGDQPGGDRGRYAITANQLDPFATAHLVPGAVATPEPTPTVAPQPTVAPAPQPTATPIAARGIVAVRSTRLRVVGRRVAISLACSGTATCKGKLAVRSVSRIKLGKRAKRVITLAGATKYSVGAGRKATVRLTLSRDGRALMASRRSLAVRVEGRPMSGAAVTRRVTLVG